MGILNRCPCDCSGTLNFLFQEDLSVITANLCPNCVDIGSSVTITNSEGVVIFESIHLNPTSCVTTTGGTSLVASGEAIFNDQPVTFTIQLLSGIFNFFILFIQRVNDDGTISFEILSDSPIEEGELTISDCP